ncbi:LysM peptidoglycan-binding and 3D domain-containing protein [Pseudoneobacillus rhizosphaerae]|uniref:Cell wall-binding protein YocH n=1 Tax=Pseudoneobacillus rhizosphaerae TaxID=2880968 RepID=A0A9C7GB88_9BACI|nr:3D domain-containing protein [Pseudoneobacillus rhizosphaerae]CAG9609008.1 Cell wall-binding protein YocH [Pseudoneobacillus rhizosphaerae]
MLKKIQTLLAVAVLSGTVSANAQAATVTVKEGDTLSELSSLHNTSVTEIKKLNQLTSDVIKPGEVLELEQKKVYTVKQGDTIWNIAKDHQVSVKQMKKWNKLNSNIIRPGKKLLIFDDISKETLTIKPSSTTVKKVSTPKVQTPKKSTKVITVKATAYTASCKGCTGITKTGFNLKANPNKKIIAVDPSVIPLGTIVHVEGYGKAIAADIGGAIKGKRIDVFIPTKKAAINFGVKRLKVTILN